MSGDDTLSVLRERPWTTLVQRLNALVAADKEMKTIRDTLLRPLKLLEILASETAGALGHDVLAAERLRNLLYLASPWSVLVEEAKQLLDGSKAADTSAHEPGVIDLKVLVLVGVAAARVAPNKTLARMFLHAVHGLALSATPAEMLGHMEPHGHQTGPLGEVVRLMVLPEAGRLTENRLFLPRFALDPLALGRWQCLHALFTQGIDAALDEVWSPPALQYAAHADFIESIRPPDAKVGAEVTLAGRFPELSNQKWPKALRVVFAAASGVEHKAEVVSFSADAITVRVPQGARPGWIGFADDRLIAETNQARRAVRRLLARMRPSLGAVGPFTTSSVPTPKPGGGCLDEAIPSKWIPDLDGLATPPRTVANRFFGGEFPKDTPTAPENVAADSSARIGTIVLFRPVVADAEGARVGREDLQDASVRLLRSRGLAGKMIELPWIDDSLAVLSSTVQSQDDPRIRGLLDDLARTALRTPGCERALWLMLVPGRGSLAVSKPAEAAAAVAVATLAGLPALLEKVFASIDQKLERLPMDRLRIDGTILPGPALRVESSRVEATERVVGPGAPRKTGFFAVALDAADRELHREPIKCLSDSRPAHFGVLFPITPEVVCVELRDSTQALFAIRRTDASPLIRGPHLPGVTRVTPVELKNDVLHWSYRHPRGVRSRAIVEVSRHNIWTPFTGLETCSEAQSLPLHRLQDVHGLRIVASDGWNASENDIGTKITERPTAIARRVNATEWWADVTPGMTVKWFLEGMTERETRHLKLKPAITGTLALVATDPKTGETFKDERALGQEDP